MKKVNIELRPYDAIGILAFCREFINDKTKVDPRFSTINEAVDNYEKQIYAKLSNDQLEDAKLECEVNYIAGRHPKKR